MKRILSFGSNDDYTFEIVNGLNQNVRECVDIIIHSG